MESSDSQKESFDDYCKKLSKWVNDQRMNLCSHYMSSQMMTMMMMNNLNTNTIIEAEKKSNTQQIPSTSQNNNNSSQSPRLNQTRVENENDSEDMPIQGQRYSLPHPLKRMLAEFIDYLLLMTIKLSIIFIVQGNLSLSEIAESIDMDFRYIVNKHKLSPAGSDQAHQQPYGGATDTAADPGGLAARAALNPFEIITMEIVYAEILNRIVITFYEAVCLSGVLCSVSATPGKIVMGLRVVACKDLFDLPFNRVEVLPGSLPGFLSAFTRSLIKNFAMVFFLPLCMTALIFSHHRTSYDLIAGTIVVKVPPPRQRRLNLAGLAARVPPPAPGPGGDPPQPANQ